MEFAIYQLEPEYRHRLWLMYISFEPKAAFQGLPPVTPTQIHEWLERLTKQRADQFVMECDKRLIGHSMLCAGPKRGEAELAIFVHQKFRGLGLGKTLLLCTLNYGCKQLGFSRVWLSVQGCNPRAQHLFESVGFRRGQRRRRHIVGVDDGAAIALQEMPARSVRRVSAPLAQDVEDSS